MTAAVLLAVLAGCGSARAAENEVADVRTRTWVWPTRVVWSTNATDAARLVGKRYGQIPEGRFLDGSGCVLKRNSTDGMSSVLLDFGREIHGGVQIGSGGRSGTRTKVRVRFGESVSEAMAELGEKNATNDHAIRDSVIDLPWAGSREIGNTGFRFVRIDLVEGLAALDFVRAVSLMRPMARIGGFRCSDERLNRVWETAVRTVHLCCQEYLWDGIKRDRLVWMGDTHPETRSILSVFGAASVLPESLDYAAETTPAATSVMNSMPNYTLWWIRNVRDWWFYTGDRAYLAKHLGYLKTVLPRILETVKSDGTQTWGGFLDWPTEHNKAACREGTCGLLAMTLGDAAEMLRVMGAAELAARCEAAVRALRGRKPDPCGSKQAAALLALGGLREPREMFAEVLGKDGLAGVSTFYGYYMLEAMSAADENQRALDTVRDYWGAMLDMGATSFWEDFSIAWTNNAFRIDQMPVAGKRDIHGDFGEFCYVGFRHSLCHGWSSGPAAWLINHVLGARVTGEGGVEVEVKPFLGDLDWAEGALATARGPVKVRVDKNPDGSLKVGVDAPEGVRVRELPAK